ncbi:hypothetical protein HZB96_05465 [Candidatus Gottesmanbacteria bacterium]|nr:hypothetical protein [Candidatus Gottesmanbacteria bacterium]
MENNEGKIKQNKYFWIIGGILLLLVGVFGWKMIFGEGDYKMTLVNAPQESVAGNNITFTWRVDGPSTTINHTSVHYGTVSHPGVLEKNVKPADTKYTDFVKDFASGKFNIPLQFIGNTVITTPGKYYFRVHALVKDKNYWSDEFSLDVVKATTSGEYKISILYPPKSVSLPVLPPDDKEATKGGLVNFTWRIEGPPTVINHTSVHYGLVSHSGVLDQNVKPADTKYADMVEDFADGKYNIPLQFVGNTNITTAGTYYYRAHALVNGKNYWTDEYSFEAK